METLVFTKEEMTRITKSIINGEESVTVDLHRLTKPEAKRFLKNLINLHINEEFVLNAIHGFHNGTVLRDMCRTEKISTRIEQIDTDIYNDGITIFKIAA